MSLAAAGLRTRTTSSRPRKRAKLELVAKPTLAELVNARTRLDLLPPAMPADPILEELEQLLPAAGDDARIAFTRVRAGDWEARTFHGLVGRGTCLASAGADLLHQLR